MTKRNRRSARAMERTRQREETSLQSRVRTELDRVTERAASTYPRLDPTIRQHRASLEKILRNSLTRTSVTSANMARAMFSGPLAASLGKTSALPTQEQLDRRISDIARERAGQRAGEIAETTRTRIANAVSRALDAGESASEISRTIVDEVGDMNLSRARTIARTETAVAMQQGQFEEMSGASEALGVKLTKTWMSTEDERTRETHLEADGQTVGLDEPFDVGGSALMYPSDPDGPPEEVINCRCAVLYNPV